MVKSHFPFFSMHYGDFEKLNPVLTRSTLRHSLPPTDQRGFDDE
jgi:hypothetical protein